MDLNEPGPQEDHARRPQFRNVEPVMPRELCEHAGQVDANNAESELVVLPEAYHGDTEAGTTPDPPKAETSKKRRVTRKRRCKSEGSAAATTWDVEQVKEACVDQDSKPE